MKRSKHMLDDVDYVHHEDGAPRPVQNQHTTSSLRQKPSSDDDENDDDSPPRRLRKANVERASSEKKK